LSVLCAAESSDPLSAHRSKRTKPVIGLAGGIGSGKSTVGAMLASLGARVIDSDQLAHEQFQDQTVKSAIRGWWGSNVFRPDGTVNRRAVADIVFRNPAELKRLEEMLYPRIAKRRDEILAEMEGDPAVHAVVIDAPKLFEAGVDRLCDAVIFVEVSFATRVNRAREARGWAEEELTRREKMQNSLDLKKARADYIIENNSSQEELLPRVQKVFSDVLASFS